MNLRTPAQHLLVASLLSLALAAQANTEAKPTTLKRAEIATQYKWDYSPIYKSWDAWTAAMTEMEAKMDAFAALKGTLKNGPAAVLKAHKAFDEIGIMQYRVYRYPQLQRDTDTRDQDVSAKYQRVNAVFARFGTTTSWFTPELLKIPQATMAQWLRQTKALAPYRFKILDSYRQQKHVLDEKGEKLLSYATRLAQAPNAVYEELSTSDIQYPKVKLSDGRELSATYGEYESVLSSSHVQADRAAMYAAHLRAYSVNINAYAAIYNGVLQADWHKAQARKYPDTLAAALDGNAIPPAVVTTLLDTVRKGTEPLRRYVRLRQKLLGVQSYHVYDDRVSIYKSSKTYPYEQSKALVLDSVAPLGADYSAKFKRFMSSRQVDVYESEGKYNGAYVAGVYGVGPYMLLNHNDTQDALFTLAHEGGHAMHTILSHETQPFATSDYTIFVAEVASTINERFLLAKLLATSTDPKERFLLLQQAVDNIVFTFYRQVLFADFELQAHRLVELGKPITAEVLGNIYVGLLKDYYGDTLALDELSKHTWARIPHFYNSPYYVYQYATCFASSAKLFNDMTSGSITSRAAATERYLTLLKSGGNDHPMKQLQKAGVDLTQRGTVQAVIDQMAQLVAQMEVEAGKIR